MKQDLEDFGRRLRLKWMYRDEEDGVERISRVFKIPSRFKPKNVDASIEVYLSHLEEELMSINCNGSNFSNLSVEEQGALRNLRNDDSIVIKSADKGSAVVVWDREDYLREADNHLLDQGVYKECSKDPLPGLQKLISDTLKKVLDKGEISKDLHAYLLVNNPRLGRFYLLPKIHKRLFSVPGRPVISNCGYSTENLSSFLDFHLQPLSTKVKSYIKDSSDFLCKLRDLPPLPDNAILCAIDVVGLYPNIPHEEGLEALRKALDGREDKSISTETLIKFADIVLKNNFFEHNSKIYQQLKGTAIGTKFAPPYAVLFMGDFEEKALSDYHLKPWVWWRYIDDIFLVWEHGEAALLEFLSYLNSLHPSIKFTYKYSLDSIEFLDVLVKKEGNTLVTDLFVKETDTHQLLHFSSCHPFHTKKGIPYGQALRLRRICSREDFFENRISDLKKWLLARDYDQQLVETQVGRAASLDRESLLQRSGRENRGGNRICFVTTFHPALSRKIYDILNRAQVILQSDEEHKKVFSEVPLVSFRRAKTLQDILVRSKLNDTNSATGSCKQCNHPLCEVCNILEVSNTFFNFDHSKQYFLRKGDYNCNSNHVVYKLTCKTCDKIYIGSTITPFRTRVNNYKSHFSKYQERKENGTLNVGKRVPQAHLWEHFSQGDHHGMEDWNFQIIDSSISENQLRVRESYWQHILQTFTSSGLNDRRVPIY